MPVGRVDSDYFSKLREEITAETDKLIDVDLVPKLLKVVNQCKEHSAPVVVSYVGIKGARLVSLSSSLTIVFLCW